MADQSGGWFLNLISWFISMYTDWDGDAWNEREKIYKKKRVVTNRDLQKVYRLSLFLSEGCGSKKYEREI